MRKRLALLGTLIVVGAALALPAATAAAGTAYGYTIKYNYCAGADPHFKVRNEALGSTRANKLTNETWVERRPGGSSTWTKIYTWPLSSYKYDIDGLRHWLTSWRTWTGDQSNWYRIGFRVRAWHNSTLLASQVVYSVKC
jgi:hypothetical protein